MVYRKLLIVHDSTVVRNILKGYILSENPDIEVIQANNSMEADEMILNQKFHIIICGQFLKGISGIELNTIRNTSQHNASTPFIVFTSSKEQRNINELKENGINHILLTPFQSGILKDLLDKVCDPRKLRSQPRYNVPNIDVSFMVYGEKIHGKAINISKTSILLEAEFKNNYPDLLGPLSISIEFPLEYKSIIINDINCRILNSKVLNWYPNDRPKKLQLVLMFNRMSDECHSKWSEVIDEIEINYMKWSAIKL
jgi:response regulator of citrate/malate metabolism